LKIRDLRQRITIESLTRTADGQGGFTESWSTFAEVWANIKPANASERYFAQRVESNITHKISIRWLESVQSEMRIQFEGRLFQIHGVRRDDEERWFMTLDCVENVGS
jgi:SPP1 family predicted phage head-tail adaptor